MEGVFTKERMMVTKERVVTEGGVTLLKGRMAMEERRRGGMIEERSLVVVRRRRKGSHVGNSERDSRLRTCEDTSLHTGNLQPESC
jgi:hypothetical protein